MSPVGDGGGMAARPGAFEEMPDCVVLPFSGRHAEAWAAQNRADLNRVRHGLRAAGLEVETDGDTTDEQNPWLGVYRLRDEEVFVHIGRTDARYLMDGSASRQPERAVSLRERVEALRRVTAAADAVGQGQLGTGVHPTAGLDGGARRDACGAW